MMNEMDNKKILTIDKSCVFKSKIENILDFNKSLFKDSYSKAERCLFDIVNFKYDADDRSNDFNNIIAFVGDRGSGKTSTMKSFRQRLGEEKDNLRKTAEQDNKDSYMLENINIKYELLDIIDPMLFSNKDSIIEIVVAQMFKEFRDKKSDDNLMKKKELARKFEKVYKDIKIINTSKGDILEQSYDNLEALIDLSSAISLKHDLNDLIKEYISYKNNLGTTSDSFIVISIDDLDMNLTVGEKMLEDIRRYLVLPNVIILMAVKFEQLEEVVAQKFSNDLKGNLELAKCIHKECEFKEGIDDKTEKYLEKLIPFSRRVYMPKLSIRGVNLQMIGFDNIETKDKNSRELKSISSIINYNINNKMGYVTITLDHYKAIIPQNLRSFIDFIVMLNSMKSPDKSENSREENIVIFKNYIRDVLVSNINDIEKRKQLTDILECKFEKLNGKSLFYLNNCINKSIDKVNERKDVIKIRTEWINTNKFSINEERIEYGDIITWVKMLQLNEANVFQDNSFEIFKCIYSVRLLEKFYNDPVVLFRETGFNFVGDYFHLTDNKRISCISREAKFKFMDIFKGKDNEYDFRFAIFDILFDKKENLNRVSRLYRRYETVNFDRYNRLLRREKKEYLIDKEYNNFTNFELSSLNMVSYCMYKNLLESYTDKYKEYLEDDLNGQIQYLKNELDDIDENYQSESLDYQYSLVINIDFWMEILKVLDSIVQLYNGQEPLVSMGKNLEYINDAFEKICSIYNIEWIDENNTLETNNLKIIKDKEKKEFEEFIEMNKMYLSNNQVNLDNYKKAKENIKEIKDYLNYKKEATAMRRFHFDTTEKINKMDIKELKKDPKYLGYLDSFIEKVEQVNTKKEFEGSRENIICISDGINLVDEFEKYLDSRIEELGNMKNEEDSSNE